MDCAGILPAPFETHEIINDSEIMRLEFGIRGDDSAAQEKTAIHEAAMQTGDNSIVDLGFVMQYRISDAFESRYGVAEIVSTLRDAAQAAVREVVGRMTVDGVLTERRGEVEIESERTVAGYCRFLRDGNRGHADRTATGPAAGRSAGGVRRRESRGAGRESGDQSGEGLRKRGASRAPAPKRSS